MGTGRPTKLTPELVEKAATYINVSGEEGVPGYTKDGSIIPTVEGFASYLKVNRDTVYAWSKEHESFSDIFDEIKNQQATMLISGALANKYNAVIAKMILSGKHGYVEKSEIDQKVSGELKTGAHDPALAAEFAAYLKDKTKR